MKFTIEDKQMIIKSEQQFKVEDESDTAHGSSRSSELSSLPASMVWLHQLRTWTGFESSFTIPGTINAGSAEEPEVELWVKMSGRIGLELLPETVSTLTGRFRLNCGTAAEGLRVVVDVLVVLVVVVVLVVGRRKAFKTTEALLCPYPLCTTHE